VGDALKKVRAGDPMRIPAHTYNTFIDAARDYLEHREGNARDAMRALRDVCIVPVRNESGADRDRFEILGIHSPIFSPSESLTAFKDGVALVGVSPTCGLHAGRFAVLLGEWMWSARPTSGPMWGRAPARC